jgi:hypothetical protein
MDVARLGEVPAPASSLWQLDLGGVVGADYVPMANDVLRMVCIQVAIQAMLVMADTSGQTALFSADFVMLVLYITLGVMLYWLALRKLLVFV